MESKFDPFLSNLKFMKYIEIIYTFDDIFKKLQAWTLMFL